MSASVIIPFSCSMKNYTMSSTLTYSFGFDITKFSFNKGYYLDVNIEQPNVPLEMRYGKFGCKDDALDFQKRFHEAVSDMHKNCACENQ